MLFLMDLGQRPKAAESNESRLILCL